MKIKEENFRQGPYWFKMSNGSVQCKSFASYILLCKYLEDHSNTIQRVENYNFVQCNRKKRYMYSSDKLEFFILMLNNGKDGCFILHNNEFTYPPYLIAGEKYSHDFLYEVATQAIDIVWSSIDKSKPWKNTAASSKLMNVVLTEAKPLAYITHKYNRDFQVYAITKAQLKIIENFKDTYRSKVWYQKLCSRVGILLALLFSLTSCTAKVPTYTEEVANEYIEQVNEDIPVKSDDLLDYNEYIINNYMSDVPYFNKDQRGDTLIYFCDLAGNEKYLEFDTTQEDINVEVFTGEEAKTKIEQYISEIKEETT